MKSKMSAEEVERELSSLTGWSGAQSHLERTFSFGDFASAMHFVNRIAALAEEQNHHPDIDIRYNRVTLRLSSHDAGGVTARDFKLAQAITNI